MKNYNYIKSKLPKNWSEVSYNIYLELYEYEKEILSDDYNDSSYDILLNKIAILTDIAITNDCFEDLELDELFKLIKMVRWIDKAPTNNFDKNINDLTIKDLNHLTLGEFIDLEYYFAEDYIKNLPRICAILYRKSKLDEWDNIIIEPYKFDIEKRKEYYNNIAIQSIYGVIDLYLKFKENFTNNYSELFNDGGEIENKELLDEITLKEIEKEIAEEEAKSKFNWENIIMYLGGDTITNADKVLDTSLIFCFNILSMKKLMN